MIKEDKNPQIALISMRSDYIESRKERRDSLDVEIYKMIHDLGFTPLLVSNDILALKNLLRNIDVFNIGLVVLSGGNDLSSIKNNENSWEIRDKVEDMLFNISIENNLPILGICRGLQFIANKLGYKLVKVKGHVNTIHKNKIINTNTYLDFNSFHSWGLKDSKKNKLINPIAICPIDDTIEAFYTDLKFNSICIMWHPERFHGQYKFSIKIIKKFLLNYKS